MPICLTRSKKNKWHVWDSASGDTLCGRELDITSLNGNGEGGYHLLGFTKPMPNGSFCGHCLRRIETLVKNVSALEWGES